MSYPKFHLGVVDFLNAYPLFYGLEDVGEVKLIRDVPSRLSELLKEEKLDAALISSVEFYRNQQRYLFYPKLCIAAVGKTESIRLFLGKNTHLHEVETLYADYASRSSVVLAKYVLGPLQKKNIPTVKWVYPPYQNILAKLNKNEAMIIIGDEALRLRHLPSLDLGEEYYRLTARSFVYALWVYFPNRQEKDLQHFLQLSWERSQNEKENLIKKASEKFGFPEEFTRYYLFHVIHYELKESLYQDMEFFFKQAKIYGIL